MKSNDNQEKKSAFKNLLERDAFFENWCMRLEKLNETAYERITVRTSLGMTFIWGINASQLDLETLIIFPGFRTSSLFWDLDNGLLPLKDKFRIFLVETNGQPNLSDGITPDIKGDDFGRWASEILEELSISAANIAGASFGGLVALKLCKVSPQKVNKVVLLNPGCLQPFSLHPKNLYYNMLPILFPSTGTVKRFLEKVVLNGTSHNLSSDATQLLVDYEVFALTRFNDKTQKPYVMNRTELSTISSHVYLILGEQDMLFPFKNSHDAAKKNIRSLRRTFVVPNVGHGIETTKDGIGALLNVLQENRN